ncbi:MAG: helix-turn-helix domain-containing protein [Saccharofermentanales bacterium]|jgi:putative transcriptional regulator
MPIVVKLGPILKQKKMPFHVFAESTGITISNLSVLKSNRAKLIRFSSLDAICRTLNCQPGDILEYMPAEKVADNEISQ